MVDVVKLILSRRCSCRSPRRLLLCILIIIGFVFFKDVLEMLTDSSPQDLTKYDKPAHIREEDNPESPDSHYWVKYPYTYNFTIDEPIKCEQQKVFLVIMVPVAPQNREHRDIIRSTWGSESLVLNKVVQLFFMLGQPSGEGADQMQQQLLEESKEHGDLIQSDFIDSYNNLTIKTMMMLEWLNLHCSTTLYVIKIDSDMFLNTKNLISMLLYAPHTNYVTGRISKGASVIRDPESKWYMPKSEYPKTFYPPYPYGLAYVFSIDMAKKLLEASRHVRAIFLEDVFVGMCIRYLNISITDPPNQEYFKLYGLLFDPSIFSKLIAVPCYESQDRGQVWEHFKKNLELPYVVYETVII